MFDSDQNPMDKKRVAHLQLFELLSLLAQSVGPMPSQAHELKCASGSGMENKAIHFFCSSSLHLCI